MKRTRQAQNLVINRKQVDDIMEKKKQQAQQKKKPVLLRELQNQLRHLEDIDDNDFKVNQDPYFTDSTLQRLQLIAKQAQKHELKEIEKLCKLAIGKRILNIELKKKKDEHNTKLQKKQKIELFFRQNRIKKLDYDTLIDEKLKESTLIVKAYENGRGFVESTRAYEEQYTGALNDCDYLNTVKEVNKIFYKNYSSMRRDLNNVQDVLLQIVWVPIVLFVAMAVSLPFASFAYEELILMGLLGLILAILFYVAVRTFFDKPNNNNQIQQSIQDVMDYFFILNNSYRQRGINIEWFCPREFMHLEVRFHDGLLK